MHTLLSFSTYSQTKPQNDIKLHSKRNPTLISNSIVRERTKMDNNMITEASPPLLQLTELIQSLEQASHMAKQLPTNSDADHRRIIFSALNSAAVCLSSFISVHDSGDGNDGGGGDEPMMIADDGDGGGDGGGGEEEEMSSKVSTMEKVEEKMREFLYIQNKRPKRPLSPVAAAMAERQGFEERESVRVPVAEFDPVETRLRNLDLVYQFHA